MLFHTNHTKPPNPKVDFLNLAVHYLEKYSSVVQ